MAIIQHINKNILPLLALVWVCSTAGCRNFEDYRTPYKSSVTIAFKPIDKKGKLPDMEILKKAIDIAELGEELPLEKFPESNIAYISLSLNPKVGLTQLDIKNLDNNVTETLTIHYQKEAVLVSHQCGCAYKYVLNKVTITQGAKCKIINKELSTFNESAIDLEIRL